ncbi:MAG: heme o synthase [Planctomycetota bacterium]|nr:heme o synthase [Planctomycetota bacterium]
MTSSPRTSPQADSQPSNSPDPGLLSDLYQLAKPRLTLLVVITSALGVAAAWPFLPHREFALTTPELLERLLQISGIACGTALMAAAANALNQWWERSPDQLMRRTAGRATATGRIGGKIILVYSLITGCGGGYLLYISGNELACILGFLSLVLYILVYTPMKRRSTLNTLLGAIPGALPPLIGWCGTGAPLYHPVGLSLFAILFSWQIPHFLAIAWMHREEYERAGFRMLPVVDPEGHRTARTALIWSLFLWALSLTPVLMGVAGAIYLAVATVAGSFITYRAYLLAKTKEVTAARRLFFASLIYLPIVLGALVANPSLS